MTRTITTENVLDEITLLESFEENAYYEIPYRRILGKTLNAILFDFDPHLFANPKSKEAAAPTWFPIKMLRQFDGDIYFHAVFAKGKGLRI